MNQVLNTIRDWSEIWALLIPLAIILLLKTGTRNLKLLLWYVCIALGLNTASTLMYVFHNSLPSFLKNNNIFYNCHSFLRVALLGLYIYGIIKHRYATLYKTLMGIYLAFVLADFIFFGSVLLFSTRLFSAESIVLLSLCLAFFVRSMQDDSDINWLKHPAFLVCAGISFYEAVNFFTFLLFYPVSEQHLPFIKTLWTIHDITFVILCLMIGLAFYRNYKKEINQQPAS